ncbi:PepSY-like domain-containing protein [uncultured Winogradskyella sp.]|uniref:PepSY-like domain-containing protein n=1 Tax=uncultured Winogradskyella sp. TaxID=395353 RepID=UPI00262EEB91|nr:PepSY-like domain-containing protein [uncultured Winogradskyella sp.]
MKTLNILTILAITVAFTSCAQNKNKKNAPQSVISSFANKFPKAKKVEWSKENENEWEADFKMNHIEYSANFSNKGEWLETEYEIKKSDIPTNIKNILDKNFTDYDIEDVEISETAQGKSFEFEIEIGEQEYKVTIDHKGNLTKKVEEENESDED